MKKAFDANVSRARPRLRLGGLGTETPSLDASQVEALAAQVAHESVPEAQEPVVPDLAQAIRERAMAAKAPRSAAAEVLEHALETPAPVMVAAPAKAEARVHVEAPKPVAPQAARAPRVTQAFVTPPPEEVEVQHVPAPKEELQPDMGYRREKLKERLKAVRENPRPEPLPDTVAEAGVLAVERISALQTELTKVRALNLALTQDLEGARRQAERATEEARLRMDEARRLSSEMDSRVKLLSELENELESLEGERNEALLALQEARQALDVRARQEDELKAEIIKRDQALVESLSEEEKLAAELELAQSHAQSLRTTLDTLRGERDTLARQVSDLTRERADLLEARKALEAVHRALTQAAAR